jgi:hypothetical protein
MSQSSEKARSEAVEPAGEDGHDEPIVVDNGPSTVLFGKKHFTMVSATQWERTEAVPIVLFFQEEQANGVVIVKDSWGLSKANKLVVTLESGESFVFALNHGGKVVAMESKSGLDRDAVTGRLMFTDTSKKVKVTRIELFKNTTSLIAHDTNQSGNTAHVKVTILMQPTKP